MKATSCVSLKSWKRFCKKANVTVRQAVKNSHVTDCCNWCFCWISVWQYFRGRWKRLFTSSGFSKYLLNDCDFTEKIFFSNLNQSKFVTVWAQNQPCSLNSDWNTGFQIWIFSQKFVKIAIICGFGYISYSKVFRVNVILFPF